MNDLLRIRFIASFTMLLLLFTSTTAMAQDRDPLTIQRLTWAGVKIASERATILIDAVGTDLWDGNAPGGLVPVETSTPRTYALVTHMHNDHLDVATLKSFLGERGYVICHKSQAAYLSSRGLKVIAVETWVPVQRGGFTMTALPAVDGFGDHQISWLITHKGRRIFHGGDTLWHGSWGLVGDQFGEIDIAFLPVNGAVVASDVPTSTPAVMMPEQAVDAALLLKASLMVPIHYGLNDPPFYVEAADPVSRVRRAAEEKGVGLRVMTPGDEIEMD